MNADQISAAEKWRENLKEDVEHVVQKLQRVVKGEVKNVDAHFKRATKAIDRLRSAKELLGSAILPCDDK